MTGLFLCLLVTASLIDGVKSFGDVVPFGLYALLALSFWVVRFRIYFFLLNAKMKQYSQLANGIMKLELTDSAAIATGGQLHLEYKWEDFNGTIESDGVILPLWNKLNFVVIPTDQLSQEALSVIRQSFEKHKRKGVSQL